MSSTLRVLMIVTAAALALAGGSAQAVLYNSHFDPIGAITFSGDGTFDIAASCLTSDQVYTGSACNAQLLGATVNVTEVATTQTGVLNFGPSSDIFQVLIAGGDLAGVNSGIIGPATSSPCGPNICAETWWVQWYFPNYNTYSTASFTTNVPAVRLYTGQCAFLKQTSPQSSCMQVGEALDVSFTRISSVPEPGTMGLLLGAGLAGWIIRRRSVRVAT